MMVQSILTYACTAGFMAACGYAVSISKRVTILEQKMKFADKGHDDVSSQIKEILALVTEISNRITRLEAKIERNN